jgi:hypothetical protein
MEAMTTATVAIQVSGTFSSPNVESRRDTGRLQSATYAVSPPADANR